MKKRRYECLYYDVMAPEKSCLFCEHCCDVFWDFTNGPYMFFCASDGDPEQGAIGNCKSFKEMFNNEEHVQDTRP